MFWNILEEWVMKRNAHQQYEKQHQSQTTWLLESLLKQTLIGASCIIFLEIVEVLLSFQYVDMKRCSCFSLQKAFAMWKTNVLWRKQKTGELPQLFLMSNVLYNILIVTTTQDFYWPEHTFFFNWRGTYKKIAETSLLVSSCGRYDWPGSRNLTKNSFDT